LTKDSSAPSSIAPPMIQPHQVIRGNPPGPPRRRCDNQR
jgi:hypothetical protein